MRKFKKRLLASGMAIGIFCTSALPAFAYTGDTQTVIPEETESTEQTEVAAQEETQEGEATPFSIPGNGEVLDDKQEDETKEFLTIQTKNGNTFFLVLDRSNNTENVYMLSMVDENDLAEFIDTEKNEETPQVVLPETEKTQTEIPEESETETVRSEKSGSMNTGALLAIGLLAAGGIGAGYYFKVVKPKKEEAQEDGEDLEFYDGGAYVNEDQPEEDDFVEENNEEI